ncbi:hypothetical protein M422DRAFT_245508 [Sphaerobolus stellatus SS14]|uniref:Metallo-beta-lactamase domain-containing protein n=1 Tax=Sphaerobolus stellatus (strain SS14) TaxID=990650 RepID=A0A0C9VP43_SPHS4|nr:hypothetical protein M422DRAFT_257661 [Sphaerobolus stellatus SS14]KIJ50258.1 hypothetical protein M422DRAFT_245508 [Sphaerobolus stellatus SS14]
MGGIFVAAVALQGAAHAELKAGGPSSHADDAIIRFTNPWPSFRSLLLPALPNANASSPSIGTDDDLISPWVALSPPLSRSRPMVIHGNPVDPIAEFDVVAETRGGLMKTPPVPANPEKFKATWLGHACFLVELPTPSGAARAPRILFDPVFSHRCGLTSCLGPDRITPPACPVQQFPEVDAIVISHCHYDHLDIPTIKSLIFPPSKPTSIAP